MSAELFDMTPEPWPETLPGGNCGCGYLGTCWQVYTCGCEWDHGQLWPCETHEKELARGDDH